MIEERAFSEGYLARLEEQREYGVKESVAGILGKALGKVSTSHKNTFEKAVKDDGIIGALTTAYKRNTKKAVKNAKNMNELVGENINCAKRTRKLADTTRKEALEERMRLDMQDSDKIAGRTGKSAHNYLTGKDATTAEKEIWRKNQNVNNARRANEGYETAAHRLRNAKKDEKIARELAEEAQNRISNYGKRDLM